MMFEVNYLVVDSYYDLLDEHQRLEQECRRQVVNDAGKTVPSPTVPNSTTSPTPTSSTTCEIYTRQINQLHEAVTSCENKIESREASEDECASELQACRDDILGVQRLRDLHGLQNDNPAQKEAQNCSVINAELVTKNAVCAQSLELEIKKSSDLEHQLFVSEVTANETLINQAALHNGLSKSIENEALCLVERDEALGVASSLEVNNAQLKERIGDCQEEGRECRLTSSTKDEKILSLQSTVNLEQAKSGRCEEARAAEEAKAVDFETMKAKLAEAEEQLALQKISCHQQGITDVHLSNGQLAGQALVKNPGLLTIFVLMILGDLGFLFLACCGATKHFCYRRATSNPETISLNSVKSEKAATQSTKETADP